MLLITCTSYFLFLSVFQNLFDFQLTAHLHGSRNFSTCKKCQTSINFTFVYFVPGMFLLCSNWGIKVEGICSSLWRANTSMPEMNLFILIGQATANWPIKLSSSHAIIATIATTLAWQRQRQMLPTLVFWIK